MSSQLFKDWDPQQEAAVQRALTLDGFGLFFQPRVGKTSTAIEICWRRKDIDIIVVIAPKNLLHIWQAQFKAGHIRAGVAFELLNYEQLFNKSVRRKLRNKLRSYNAPMVILDESHRAKRRSSKQSRACRTLTACSKYRLALSGTTIAQGLQDAWAVFDFLDPAVFGEWEDFKRRYLIMDGYWKSKVTGYKNLGRFNRILHAHSDHVSLSSVANRPLRIQRKIVALPMVGLLRKHYRELEAKLVTEYKKVRIETPLVITLALRLQQMTGGFISSGKDFHSIDSSKLAWVTLLQVRDPSPLVICARYLPEIDAIARECRRLRRSVRVVKGGEPLDTPWTEDVCIIQVASGVGIDLSRSKHIVFYSWDHSYINYEQMRFRVLSRENTSAKYTFLMIRESIDEAIYESFTKKRKLADAVRAYARRS